MSKIKGALESSYINSKYLGLTFDVFESKVKNSVEKSKNWEASEEFNKCLKKLLKNELRIVSYLKFSKGLKPKEINQLLKMSKSIMETYERIAPKQKENRVKTNKGNSGHFSVKEKADPQKKCETIETVSFKCIAKNLPIKDKLTRSSDPYFQICKINDELLYTSEIILKNLNPEWKNRVSLAMSFSENTQIKILIWDFDKWEKDDYIGEFEMCIGDLRNQKEVSFTIENREKRIKKASGRKFKEGLDCGSFLFSDIQFEKNEKQDPESSSLLRTTKKDAASLYSRNFHSVNQNADSWISETEWKDQKFPLGDLLFTAFESSQKKGHIFKTDFINYLFVLSEKGTPDEKIKFIYHVFDPMNTGVVSKPHFFRVYLQLMSVIEDFRKKNLFDDLDLSKNEEQKLSTCETLFSLFDQDHDGQISVEEWKDLLLKNKSQLRSLNGVLKMVPTEEKVLMNKLGVPSTFGSDHFCFVLAIMSGLTMCLEEYNGSSSSSSSSSFSYGDTSERSFSSFSSYELLGNKRYFRGEKMDFIAFSPKVFASIRSIFGVDEILFKNAFSIDTLFTTLICSGQLNTLSGSTSAGKSGAFFLYSYCGSFICKTITKGEKDTLISILPKYLNHIHKEKGKTLLTKIYGLFQINKDTFFIVMENVFKTEHKLDIIYDLKGSRKGRTNQSVGGIKKDLDFIGNDEKMNLGEETAQKVREMLERDAQFLKSCGIIDYSFLLGIHYVSPGVREKGDQIIGEAEDKGVLSKDSKAVYYFGIIDHLIFFGGKKKAENIGKTLLYGKTAEVSVVPPDYYCDRFLGFLKERII